MAKSLEEWVDTDVAAVREQSIRWLSEGYFFRDPIRPIQLDSTLFFAPADGVILYQRRVRPDEPIVDIKGRPLSLQDAMRMPGYDQESLVIGIFMTFYDVHVNRVPYSGRISYRELEPLDTYNHPMLDIEKSILDELRVDNDHLGYLHMNQRVLNRIHAPKLGLAYHVLQIADFDVDSITPFELKQNWPATQNHRFSQIRYGSQVDLILPLRKDLRYELVQADHMHVEAGIDPLVRLA